MTNDPASLTPLVELSETPSLPWVDFCPHCSSSDLRQNSVSYYVWCGICGHNNKSDQEFPA